MAERVAKREDALLGASLFLVAPRAADARVEAEFGDRIEQRHGLVAVAALPGVAQNDASLCNRIFDRAHDQALAKLRRAMVAKGDDLGKIVPGIDVQQWERKRARAEGLFRQRRSSTSESLPPEKRRAGCDIAPQLRAGCVWPRLEPAEMIGIGRARLRNLVFEERGLEERGIGHAGTPSARTITSSGRLCSPHSL